MRLNQDEEKRDSAAGPDHVRPAQADRVPPPLTRQQIKAIQLNIKYLKALREQERQQSHQPRDGA